MGPQPKDFDKYLKITLGMLIWIIFGVMISTFTVTTIYWRFQLVEEEQKVLELESETADKEQKERMEYINNRIDRKFDQLKKELEKER